MNDMDRLQIRLAAWMAKTFPEADEASVLAHLKREVESELHEGCELDEIADVAILAMQLASKRGANLRELIEAKHEVNLGRTWGEKNEDGFWEHVKTKPKTPPRSDQDWNPNWDVFGMGSASEEG